MNRKYNLKTYRASIAVALCLTLMSLFFAGCDTADIRERMDEADEAEQYDFSVFLGDAGDPVKISELINRYRDEKGVSINPIITEEGSDNERALWRALESGNPPAAFLISSDDNMENISEGGFLADFSFIDSAKAGQTMPYLFQGYGWAVDKRLIADLVGAGRADAFIADIRSADYAEWNTFVQKLSAYILNGTAEPFGMNGKEYSFPAEKGAYATNLNGVFAVAGGDPEFCVDTLLALALCTSDLSAWEALKKLANDNAEEDAEKATPPAVSETPEEVATDEAFNLPRPALSVYTSSLNDITTHLAGRYAPGIRSKGFVNAKVYGQKNAREIFAEGKAAFAVVNSEDFSSLSKLNAVQANNLVLLPIKFPYAENGVSGVFEERPVNRCIPLRVTHSFAVNGKSSPESQKMALDFLLWMDNEDRTLTDALENSVREYYDRGDVLPYAPHAQSLQSYAEALREKNLSEYLTHANWDDVYKENLLNFMFTTWYEK
ncbi:MAG: hypothetical protein LBQ21_00475 [Clostridiales Family XIII bacterium]|jgi:ABC-type glycerol-3-phosphate transport system substrate-binding protein|nr:hypothetical protein [Clostridiales Family XIII bacterium]